MTTNIGYDDRPKLVDEDVALILEGWDFAQFDRRNMAGVPENLFLALHRHLDRLYVSTYSHLVPFGYAPGHYMGTCRSCGAPGFDLDKRAVSCRACAERKHAERAATPTDAEKYQWLRRYAAAFGHPNDMVAGLLINESALEQGMKEYP